MKSKTTYGVCIKIFPECMGEEPHKCPGQHSVPHGQYGGARCTCPCHNRKSVEIPKPGTPIDHNGG